MERLWVFNDANEEAFFHPKCPSDFYSCFSLHDESCIIIFSH